MGTKILTSGDIEIGKDTFYCYKSRVFLDVNIDNILVPNKTLLGEKICKCLIGYLYDDYGIKSSRMRFPRMSV